MEKILEAFREPSIDSYLLEKTLLKDFSEPFSVAIIAHCPKKMKILSLILRNMEEKAPPTVIISPYREQVQTLKLDKGKNPLS